jgi:hypothetical protein
LVKFLEGLWDKYNILDWLWTILDDKQKAFVKNNLIKETIFLLGSYL